MNYEFTIFKNQFDNKTDRRYPLPTWDKFVGMLYDLSEQEGRKGGNNSSPLITPAVFQTNSTRSNKSTLYWGGWCCVDVDDHVFPSDLVSLKNELITKFSQYDFVVYSTASSRNDHPKFRIVFRTDEAVENERIKKFWYALNTELGEIGDPQTKDLARMYYVPARYPNAFHFIF